MQSYWPVTRLPIVHYKLKEYRLVDLPALSFAVAEQRRDCVRKYGLDQDWQALSYFGDDQEVANFYHLDHVFSPLGWSQPEDH